MRIEIRKPFRRTLPYAVAREGFTFMGLNFHIASADPFGNGCFAEFAGFSSTNGNSNLEEAIYLGKSHV